MTERARRLVGGDDCQNRAARRYEKCSYLWHYFRRFEPFRRFPRSPLSARLANRTPVPLPPLSPRTRPDLLLCLPTAVVSQSARRSYFLSSLPSSSSVVIVVVVALHHLLLLLRRPSRPPSSPPLNRPTPRPVGGPTTDGCAQRGDCPHRRGHYFNVTLIKSNNQYLPRKKF